MMIAENMLDTVSGMTNEVLDGEVSDVLNRHVGLFVHCHVGG